MDRLEILLVSGILPEPMLISSNGARSFGLLISAGGALLLGCVCSGRCMGGACYLAVVGAAVGVDAKTVEGAIAEILSQYVGSPLRI